MELLFIFLVWFVIGTFLGSYLAKKGMQSSWTIANEVQWWIKLLSSRQR